MVFHNSEPDIDRRVHDCGLKNQERDTDQIPDHFRRIALCHDCQSCAITKDICYFLRINVLLLVDDFGSKFIFSRNLLKAASTSLRECKETLSIKSLTMLLLHPSCTTREGNVLKSLVPILEIELNSRSLVETLPPISIAKESPY